MDDRAACGTVGVVGVARGAAGVVGAARDVTEVDGAGDEGVADIKSV
jgi:hypothetical protein